MRRRENKNSLKVDKEGVRKLNENEMNKIIGSGNSQVRYISDEYIQARILKMRMEI